MKLYIDYGGTNFRYQVANESEIIKEDKLFSKDINLIEFIENMLKSFKINFVGISFAGQVNDGVIVSAPNINTKTLNIKEYFYSKYKLQVEIDNDLKCAALAEYSAKKEAKMLIALYIGTGVGSAIIENGKIVRGSLNLAGEIGHISYKEAPFKCGCGKNDCLELYLSGSGIIKWAEYHELSTENISLKALENEEIEASCKFAKGKVISAKKEILDNFYKSLSFASSLIVTLFNPDYLIIGGGIVQNNPKLVDFIKDEVKNRAFSPSTKNLTIELSHLSEGSLNGTKFLKNY